MPLPEGFDWSQPAPGYEKAWGGMRSGDKQSTWEYVLGQEGRQEAEAQAGQQAMESLMNAPAPQRRMQGPGQGQGPMNGQGRGLMNPQAPPGAGAGPGIGIGGGQAPGSILDLIRRR